MEQIVSALSQAKGTSHDANLSASKKDGTESGGVEGFFANLLVEFQSRNDVMPKGSGGAVSLSTAGSDKTPHLAVLTQIAEANLADLENINTEAKETGVLVNGKASALESEHAALPGLVNSLQNGVPGTVQSEKTNKKSGLQVLSSDALIKSGSDPPDLVMPVEPKAASQAPKTAISMAIFQEFLSSNGVSQGDILGLQDIIPVTRVEPGGHSILGLVAKMDGPVPGATAEVGKTTSALPNAEQIPLRSVPDYSIKSIKYMMENNVELLRMRLVPRSLGELQISVVKIDDVSRVIISSANPMVREFLESQISILRDSLLQGGIHVNDVTVQSRPISIGDNSSNRNLQQQASGQGGDSRSDPSGEPVSTMSGKDANLLSRHHDGILNLYV
ncbi:MAG: hypothetical protein COA73_10575 [Candidatus Hydrogenedentota bacterium]|nr:MAG: hypothetical protein COA73_10575 [Candidatus Hydrogenedentota bacterium]